MSSGKWSEGSEGQSVYATKERCKTLTRSWAKELGKQGVRVVGVAPESWKLQDFVQLLMNQH